MLRVGGQSAGFKEVESFNSSGGGEGPAGTALALVFNGGDGTLGSPIDGSGDGSVDGGVLSDGLGGETIVEFLELSGGEVHESVEIHIVGSLGVGHVLLDLLVVGVEDGHSVVLIL